MAIPEKSRSRRQSYRGSPRRNRRMSGGSYRAITDDDSFGLGTDVSIDFEELSSPILERPTTLPEMNSRPASRVMKSFSCDEVRELEIWNINIRFSDIRLHKRSLEHSFYFCYHLKAFPLIFFVWFTVKSFETQNKTIQIKRSEANFECYHSIK